MEVLLFPTWIFKPTARRRQHQLSLALILIYCLLQTSSETVAETAEVNQTDTREATTAAISPSNSSTVIPNDAAVATELPTSTAKPASHAPSAPPRIYLQKGNLKDLAENSDSDGFRTSYQNPNGIQTSLHIYVIWFIGIMPAAIGVIAWLQNLKRKCMRPGEEKKEGSSSDVEKSLSHSLMKADKNKVPIDHLVHQIARRAEMSNGQGGPTYNSYRSKLIKSRRVYSLEVPRKCLEMIEILGEGNFGQVWKARSYQIVGGKSKPTFVAVKTNKVNANVDEQEDLLKELDIMLQLGSHPNVVRLLGCCTENEPYYLVLEYIPMGKLLSFLRRNRKDGAYYTEPDCDRPPLSAMVQNNNYMTYCNNDAYGYSEINPKAASLQSTSLSPYDLIQFAYQISKGMEFISSHGIIHRDLAARNILVDEHKVAKVADFGLSRSIRDKEGDMYEMKHAGQMPIRWMSPEALSMGLFSTKSDTWAFGILLFEIFTLGSTPYIGMSAQEVVSYVRQGNICGQPEHCSDELYELMRSCWAYRPDDRFSFTDIKHQLAKMLLDIKQENGNYIDLKHFNGSLYYFNADGAPDEKL